MALIACYSAFANGDAYKQPYGIKLGETVPTQYRGAWLDDGYSAVRVVRLADDPVLSEYRIHTTKMTKVVTDIYAVFRPEISCTKQKAHLEQFLLGVPNLTLDFETRTFRRYVSDDYSISASICSHPALKVEDFVVFAINNESIKRLRLTEQWEYEGNDYLIPE